MVAVELVEFAGTLADAARGVTLGPDAGRMFVENKAPLGAYDPVTEADRGAERAMRDLIAPAYPDHSVSGEEFGHQTGRSAFTWSLDPIDGTRSYVSGLPTWTTLIALLEQGEPVVGLVDVPRLDERYLGLEGQSWMESAAGKAALRVSGCARLGEARLATTDPFLFKEEAFAAFRELSGVVRTTRYGQDAYAYARLAAGTIDLVIECGLHPHDYHALVPVVRGAGGVFGDWAGGTDFGAGRVIAAASRQLYEAALEFMTPAN